MSVTLHRVNTLKQLKEANVRFGVEIDIRHDPHKDVLYLNHDPGHGDQLADYLAILKGQDRPLTILNIKEAGIERRVIDLMRQHSLTNWFLLDVEFPFIYKATFSGVDGVDGRIAVRYSEAEPIEQALLLSGKCAWVWVDVNTTLPLDREVYARLRNAGYKLALVCPERWGRPHDIEPYIAYLKRNDIFLDTVMTSSLYAKVWADSGVLL